MAPHALPFVFLLLTCASLASCRVAPLGPPANEFARLEQRLEQAQSVRMDFHVTAEGAVEADLRGSLRVEGDQELHLRAEGTFAGKDVQVSFHSTTTGSGDEGAGHDVDASGRELRDAVLVGLTRMGILHNLARLSAQKPIDHGTGGVRDWVTVGALRSDPERPRALVFDLSVAGEPSGTASLELGPTGSPTVRHQTVHFPDGDMRVVERYSDVELRP